MTRQEDLSVQEALALVLSRFGTLPAERVPLLEGLNRIITEDVTARDSLPPFANSAMDGYAVRAADVQQSSRETPVMLDVVADIAAGAPSAVEVSTGTAARIMTGAPLPPGADAVVPVEATDEPWRAAVRSLPVRIEVYQAVGAGDYVRYPGEDVQKGATVLPAGHLLRPQEIGVLASLGVSHVDVVRRPRVGVLATGDELVAVEEQLAPGKIRNSNSYAQTAQLVNLGALPVSLGIAGDDEANVRARLKAGLDAGIDLFISSAGVSVGAYDVVKAVLESEGNVGFWRVRMRPGKPLAFGTYRGVPYLGLPGNPVSAMVSFERFARPAILKMAGHQRLQRPELEVRLLDGLNSDGRETYARALVTRNAEGDYEASFASSQGSHIMTSLVAANALVVVPEGMQKVEAGQVLRAIMIDWPTNVF